MCFSRSVIASTIGYTRFLNVCKGTVLTPALCIFQEYAIMDMETIMIKPCAGKEAEQLPRRQ